MRLGFGCAGGAVVFSVTGGQFVGGITPIIPAFGPNVRAQIAIQIRHARVGTPGTSEISHWRAVRVGGDAVRVHPGIRVAGEFAIEKHKAIRCFG